MIDVDMLGTSAPGASPIRRLRPQTAPISAITSMMYGQACKCSVGAIGPAKSLVAWPPGVTEHGVVAGMIAGMRHPCRRRQRPRLLRKPLGVEELGQLQEGSS